MTSKEAEREVLVSLSQVIDNGISTSTTASGDFEDILNFTAPTT